MDVEEEGVDGEISAFGVVEQGCGFGVRLAGGGVVGFFAGGDEFDIGAGDADHCRSESGIDLGVFVECFGESLGVEFGDDVEVVFGGASEQGVADGASDEVEVVFVGGGFCFFGDYF